MKNKARIPETVIAATTFHAYKNYVVAIMQIGNSTVGIRFNSPEQILEFMTQIFEKASIVWPDNEYVKEFKS